jgi:hypothetical protein
MGVNCCGNREGKEGEEPQPMDMATLKKQVTEGASGLATSVKNVNYKDLGDKVKSYDYTGAADKVKAYDYKGAAEGAADAAKAFDYKGKFNEVRTSNKWANLHGRITSFTNKKDPVDSEHIEVDVENDEDSKN